MCVCFSLYGIGLTLQYIYMLTKFLHRFACVLVITLAGRRASDCSKPTVLGGLGDGGFGDGRVAVGDTKSTYSSSKAPNSPESSPNYRRMVDFNLSLLLFLPLVDYY